MINELKKLCKSFRHAFCGIHFCIVNERNFRIHIVAIFYVLILGFLCKISVSEYLILIMCFAQVISGELLNTAIEVLCDKENSGYNVFIKRAKDIAAAAVLVCAIGCILIGLMIFLPKTQTLISSLNLFFIGIIILSAPLNLWFIFRRRK